MEVSLSGRADIADSDLRMWLRDGCIIAPPT